MGFRFRKSVKIAPGVRLNFGKKSTSVSLGGKGARYTINSNGKKTASVGIPGTGLYYTESVGGKKTGKEKNNMSAMKVKKDKTTNQDKPKKPFFKKVWFWIVAVGILFSIVTGGGSDTPESTTPNAPAATIETKEEEQVKSVVTEEPEEAAPTVEPEEVVSDPEPPAEEPKVEEPVATPVPEEPVVETPPVVQPEPDPDPEAPVVEPVSEIVYVSKSGKKYHSIPDCSGMKKPLEMTKAEAEKTRKPCENCW